MCDKTIEEATEELENSLKIRLPSTVEKLRQQIVGKIQAENPPGTGENRRAACLRPDMVQHNPNRQ